MKGYVGAPSTFACELHVQCRLVCIEWLAELPFLADATGTFPTMSGSPHVLERTRTSGRADADASATEGSEYEVQSM